MIQIGSGVVPLSPDHAVNPKRTTDVLQKPDNSKSYRHAGIGAISRLAGSISGW
jgi:hypothetical protein